MAGVDACIGNGYEDHKNGKRDGARLLRIEKTTNFSVHDIILVDAPMFHFVMSTVTNGEAYNMAIRGGDWGGLDGVDVWGTNVWIHDVSSLSWPSFLLLQTI
jgi:rhamnogalacturonan hydrolase